MNNWLKIFRFGNYSLRTKLLVSMISTSVLLLNAIWSRKKQYPRQSLYR